VPRATRTRPVSSLNRRWPLSNVFGALPDAKRVGQLLGDDHDIAARAGERVKRTFLFTDIVGSTPLVEALGDDAWQELLRWHDQTLRTIFNRYGGTEVRQTGDGFFFAFEDASSAIEAAVAVQRSLAEHRRGHGFAPQVRIGLHEAEAATRAVDFAGRGVHEAARLGSSAGGGQILASMTTVQLAATRFPISAPRTVTLKGVSQPVDVVTIEWM
jgi:class 3 adenylate cyclase